MISADVLGLFRLWFQSCFGCGFDCDFGLGSAVVLTAVVGLVWLWFWIWLSCGFDCGSGLGLAVILGSVVSVLVRLCF